MRRNFISLLLIKKKKKREISLACTRLLSPENASLLQVLNEIRAGAPGLCLRGEAGRHTGDASDLNTVLFIYIKKRMCCKHSSYTVKSESVGKWYLNDLLCCTGVGGKSSRHLVVFYLYAL